MIPAEFDYVAPDTLDGAIKALSDGGEDAKLLAGGHSLLPLMKLRLAAPSLLVDLRKVPGLHGIERQDGSWRIGALTPHAELEHSPRAGCPLARRGDDRRPAGPQPGHDRRIARPRRPRLRPAGGAADRRGVGHAQGLRRAALDRGRRPVPGLPGDRRRSRRGDDRGSASPRSTAGASATRSSTAAARTGRWSRSARSSSRATGYARTCGSGSPTWAPCRCERAPSSRPCAGSR